MNTHGYPEIRTRFERTAPELVKAARELPAAILADVQGRRGTLHGRIAPLSPSMKMAGPAITVEVRPGDNLMIHAALAVAKPGELFSYGPQPLQVFGEVLRLRLGVTEECVAGYLDRRIFYPLQIRPAWWRRDEDGHPHLPSGARLTAREWAKFGEMVRRDGHGVLPPGKLAQLFVGTEANPGHGVTWWLPAQGPVGAVGKRAVADDLLPRDTWVAAGAGGQRLVVIPSLKLVAVRLAPVRLHETGFDDHSWLVALVTAARS